MLHASHSSQEMGNRSSTYFKLGDKSLRSYADGTWYWIVQATDGTELKSEVTTKCTTLNPTADVFTSEKINVKNTALQFGILFDECRNFSIKNKNLAIKLNYTQFQADLSAPGWLTQWDIESCGANHFSRRVYVIDMLSSFVI